MDASGVVHSSVSTEEPELEPQSESVAPERCKAETVAFEAPAVSEASEDSAAYEDEWTAWGRRAVLGLDGYRIRYPGPVALGMLTAMRSEFDARCRVVLTEETPEFTEMD